MLSAKIIEHQSYAIHGVSWKAEAGPGVEQLQFSFTGPQAPWQVNSALVAIEVTEHQIIMQIYFILAHLCSFRICPFVLYSTQSAFLTRAQIDAAIYARSL